MNPSPLDVGKSIHPDEMCSEWVRSLHVDFPGEIRVNGNAWSERRHALKKFSHLFIDMYGYSMKRKKNPFVVSSRERPEC